MKIIVRCLKNDYVVCPVCGSRHVVGIQKESCHCGQCGQMLDVMFVNRVLDNEETEAFFMQMSLFDE